MELNNECGGMSPGKSGKDVVDAVTGVKVGRYFTTPGMDALDEVTWTRRSATIKDAEGKTIFEQHGIEAPASWSALATNVVASKYFRGQKGAPDRESSVRDLILRVVVQITQWGLKGGYFASNDDAITFREELTHLLVRQKMSFNSPVWFNLGAVPHPQVSACFIQAVEDTMDSIMALAASEARLFKQGSGTGSNLSKIRGSMEPLSAGGMASGPVSFMRGFDSFAGVIKSGGRTRRAAKLVCLDADHPDIEEFVTCKAEEERRARILIENGVEGAFNAKGSAYESVGFQNANHSVRVSDEFMRAVEADATWPLTARTTGAVVRTVSAREVFGQIAQAAWECGDPGLQFDTTINRWNPCADSDRINASNPCSEFMFLDNTACNLASLNLMQFRTLDGAFDVESFRHAVRVSILAMEIMVSNASYPTKEIADMSERFRPLGLGYANLGALLMSSGMPYDSADGRAYAAAITSLMTAEAYGMSAGIAAVKGPFEEYEKNHDAFAHVLQNHADVNARIGGEHGLKALDYVAVRTAASQSWTTTLKQVALWGVRNAQATLLAPTGTIGFMLDVDTTGVEPDIALVKTKKLVGGGAMKIVNQSVPLALRALGYSDADVASIVRVVNESEDIGLAQALRDEHKPIFDCALPSPVEGRSISWEGHVRMMAAIQPFLSGAISKTVNMPRETTPDDIEKAYMMSWKSGLKSVAIYRDGCKQSQPLNVKSKEKVVTSAEPPKPIDARRRLPDERPSVTHKFAIGEHEGYMTVGFYEDGTPGEVFIRMSKEGSTVAGLMDTLATTVSMALQYGVPLRAFVDKFSHVRFEPAGTTPNPQIRFAKSIVDYIFRYLGIRFLNDPPSTGSGASLNGENGNGYAVGHPSGTERSDVSDAPPCRVCGTIMQRNGACHRCPNCGLTDGCS